MYAVVLPALHSALCATISCLKSCYGCVQPCLGDAILPPGDAPGECLQGEGRMYLIGLLAT